MQQEKWRIHNNFKLQENCCIYSKSNMKNLFTKDMTCIASVKCFRGVSK